LGAAVAALLVAFAAEFGTVDGVEHMKFAGRTDTSLVREFFQLHGIPATAANFQRFFERYVFLLEDTLHHSHGGAIPGVRDFLQQLQALRRPPLIGLLTGNIRLGAEIKLRHFGLWGIFHTGGFGDDHEDRNHIAVIARDRGSRVLRENLRGEQIVVVGDTPHDIRCGQAMGAKVLAVATGGSKLEELQPHKPDWLVADLRGLQAVELCEA
jgi:phosphoglycolate phosphatase-like HAD superfamily hydrolase